LHVTPIPLKREKQLEKRARNLEWKLELPQRRNEGLVELNKRGT
jgi:hypothetical protein